MASSQAVDRIASASSRTSVAKSARQDHFAFNITRHEVRHFADRIWHLRHQFTSYDACHLVLAEALGAPLYTCDTKLASAGQDVEVRVVSPTH